MLHTSIRPSYNKGDWRLLLGLLQTFEWKILEQITASINMQDAIIALFRGMILVPWPRDRQSNERLAASLQAELMRLGFMMDEKAFKAVGKASEDWIVSFYKKVIPALKVKMGDSHAHVPFYRNFPTQVMDMSTFELFVNAIIHYWSDGRWEPAQEVADRGMEFEDIDFKMVTLGTEKDFLDIFTRLASGNQSITIQDKEILEWFIDNHRSEIKIPTDIPFKETLCILAGKGLDVPMTSPTDVLRVAVYLSGGDISLSNVPKPISFLEKSIKSKFRKFSRPERRRLLSLLEKTDCSTEEMQRYLGKWLRLGEVLHPGEYRHQFPKAAESFYELRNQPPKIRTFNGKVDLAFTDGHPAGIKLLATRPGEFARRLDWMLRKYDTESVINTFCQVGPKVSGKVLFELYKHFENRSRANAPRVVMLKGARSKMKTLDPLPPLDKGVIDSVRESIINIIEEKISDLPKLGRVWIDERLRDVPVPFSMRSLNASVKTYVRGTRVPFKADAKVIRAFLHWYDEDGSVDLDLSAEFLTESLMSDTHISFTNLKNERINCCHSGDIRHRQGACAEYVDIDIERCLEAGVRYVVMQAYNFDGNPFNKVKDAVFGLMEREFPESNKIFVPATISNCAKLANDGSSLIVCILDLEKKCFIWADLESEGRFLEGMRGKSYEAVRTFVSKPALSIYDLLCMHARSRGLLVMDKDRAKVAFGWEEFTSDYSNVIEYMNI